jgi:ribokinase
MKIINLGSLNIDHVYQVSHFVRPGETLSSSEYSRHPGGKGLNQSVALARAGAAVAHLGKVGGEGIWLRDVLQQAGANVAGVIESVVPTGHAIIQVDARGQNSILLFGGANQSLTAEEVGQLLATGDPGDILLLQNEVNRLPEIVIKARERGLHIALNPAPFDAGIRQLPLGSLRYLILNEVEGADLTGESNPERILAQLAELAPECAIVLTLGADGVRARYAGKEWSLPAERVAPIDTTAAGDTFIGFFLAARSRGLDMEESLTIANHAASVCVTRRGAAVSIPTWAEVVGS